MQHQQTARLKKLQERSRVALAEREEHEVHLQAIEDTKSRRRKMILAVIIAVLVISSGGLAFAFLGPGNYDAFAKCLTAKGVKMYGEDWCQYTNAQKAMFGNSFRYIDYEVKENLKMRPTWVIDGITYETVQSFERLSALTGCQI